MGDFKAIIRMNMIKDCSVTTEDIVIIEKILRPEIGALKGKITRRKTIPVVDDYIEIPKESVEAQHNITLRFDIIYINGLAFITTIFF